MVQIADYKNSYVTSLNDWRRANNLEWTDIEIKPVSVSGGISGIEGLNDFKKLINMYNKEVVQYDAIVDFKESYIVDRVHLEDMLVKSGVCSLRGTGVKIKK